MLTELLQEVLLRESVSVNDIDDAMDNHKRVIINYHSRGEDIATGARVIEVYAYGLTKAGNPVIRAFQPYGDTTSKVPSWKFFRLDRISAWKETGQTFSRPASDIYKGLGDFNPYDDKTMSVVYKITSFGDDDKSDTIFTKTNPKLKQNVFKTDTEKNMERLRQQVLNPIKLSDIKTKNGFKDISDKPGDTGPKLKPQRTNGDDRTNVNKKQPVQQTDNVEKQTIDSTELDNLRKKLGDTSKPISMKDFNDRLSSNETEPYRTDTERGMERLRQQLENPRKIDLSKIPRK
jgi:hypothetical protein